MSNLSLERVQDICFWSKKRAEKLKKQYVDCPFCKIQYTGYYQKPNPESCPCCFGFGKVPSIMVEKIKKTHEYRVALQNASSGDIRD